jgi:hypothetical protein
MTGEKLCPLDKKPCIRERCAIFHEELQRCCWAISAPSPLPPPRPEPNRKKQGYEKPSQFKAHLFD